MNVDPSFKQWKTNAAHRRHAGRELHRDRDRRATAADSMFGWFWTTTFGAGRERAAAC